MLTKLKAFSIKRIALIAALVIATAAAAIILGNSIHTVNIFDGENSYKVKTLSGDAVSALENVNLKSQDYKVTLNERNGRVTTINLAYTFPVYVTMGEQTTEYKVIESTVGEILALAGHTPDEHDMIEPSIDTVIKKTAYIDYANIDYTTGSYTEAIPCSTDVVYSNQHDAGTSSVVSLGTDGVKQIEYTEKIVNGQPVERVVNNITVLSDAVNGKKIVGTRKKPVVATAVTTSSSVNAISTLTPPAPIELDANGVPVNYTKKMTVGATAYTHTGHNCSTGVRPQPGYIAVNPKVIPYGTKMYIKSADGKFIYGYAVAADTGGFIKKYPTNVDLFFDTVSGCYSFGRRNVEIYILP